MSWQTKQMFLAKVLNELDAYPNATACGRALFATGDWPYTERTCVDYAKEAVRVQAARNPPELEPEIEVEFTLGKEEGAHFYHNKADGEYVIHRCAQFPKGWRLLESELAMILEGYSKHGQNLTREECARTFGFKLGQMNYLLGTVFKHFHASLPFTTARMAEASDEELVDQMDLMQEARVMRKMDQKRWKETVKDAELWRNRRKQLQLIIMALVDAFEQYPMPNVPACAGYGAEGILDVLPLYDLHIGARDVTGEVQEAPFAEIKRLMQGALGNEGRLVLGGDTFHYDTVRRTTSRGTPQDGVFPLELSRMVMRFVRWLMHEALLVWDTVEVVVLSGNHDEFAMMILRAALEYLYDDPRVTIVGDEYMNHRYVEQYGVNMLVYEHGDGGKIEKLMDAMAVEHPFIWGTSKFRHAFTGHLHHEVSKNAKGATGFQQSNILKSDQYHNKYLWLTSESKIQMYSYDKDAGPINIGIAARSLN